METMYHVASPDYVVGEDLYCASRLQDMGRDIASKWDGGLVDTDVVCLFETREDAEDFRLDFQPEGIMLEVNLPDDDPEICMTQVEEGYPAVFSGIPAAYIKAL